MSSLRHVPIEELDEALQATRMQIKHLQLQERLLQREVDDRREQQEWEDREKRP